MSLGKGLGALITPTGGRKQTTYMTGGGTGAPDRLWSVPLSEIKPNPDQPRKLFKPDELNELASSIKEHGILQPLVVVEKSDGGYELIAGERRWRAASIAGLTVVPVVVKEFSESQKLEVALIENIQRENLNPIEEAFGYKRLIEEFGYTQAQVAEKVGKSRPAIANAVRLLELPPEVHQALSNGEINSGQARALLTLPTKEQQIDMLSSMRGSKISVRELERTAAKSRPPEKSRRDANLVYLEDELREALGTKVHITEKGGRGTIVIDFYSQDERDSIVKKILPN